MEIFVRHVDTVSEMGLMYGAGDMITISARLILPTREKYWWNIFHVEITLGVTIDSRWEFA